MTRLAAREGILVTALGVALLLGRALAYEYTEPMKGFRALPLDYPEMPFVLRFSRDELLSQPLWTQRVDGIVIEKAAPSPIRIGAEALRAALLRLRFGDAPIIELERGQTTLSEDVPGEWFIVLGVPDTFQVVRALVDEAGLEVTDAALNGDGFIVKPMAQGRREFLVIASPVSRGVLYGAYELEERTTHRGVPRIDDRAVPAVRYRSWAIHNFLDEPLGVNGRWRYNVSLTFAVPWRATLLYSEFPELGGEKERDAIRANQEALRRKFRDAAQYGAIPTLVWNPMSFQLAPEGASPEALANAHPGVLAKPAKFRSLFCPSDPATRQFLVTGVRELVQTFPELEMLIPFWSDDGGELHCGCEKCAQVPFIERVVEYSRLVMDTARSVNPNIRFMMRMHGLDCYIPSYHPEYVGDPTRGLGAVTRRLGKDMEAVLNEVTTPPGMDLQSWLFGKETTMLGSGVPTYLLFHYYEAGGPGIAAPLSPVQTHLSWALPIYLDRLRKCVRPFQGVVGGMSPQGGMEVAWWYPEMDPHKFMRNWCQARYGEQAGECVYEALVDTHKITEAFYMQTAPETFNLYRWGPYLKPWATPMTALSRIGFTRNVEENATFDWNQAHAKQPDELKRINLDDKDRWLARFAVTEELAIAERAETMMGKAAELEPAHPEIQYLYELAKATNALVHLFRDYHQAMVYAGLARNMSAGEARDELAGAMREHLKRAIEDTVDYSAVYQGFLEDLGQRPRRDYVEGSAHVGESGMQFYRLWWDLHNVFLPCLLSVVREAAYLADEEFPGESLLALFDADMGIAP